MPTGSLAPDSPSSRVPDRPPISRRPSTENTTAGSVGARATPRSRAGRQSKPKTRCASRVTPTVVTSVPTTADPQHRTGRGPEPAPADVHAAVEQQQDQHHRHDPLDRDDRDVVETGDRVRRDRGGHQEDGRRRDPDALAEPVGPDGEQPGHAHDGDEQREGDDVGHGADSRCAGGRPSGSSRTCGTCCRPGFPAHRDRAYRCSQVGGWAPATGQRPCSRPHAVVSHSRQVQRSTGLLGAVAAQPGQDPAGQVGQLLLLVAGQDLQRDVELGRRRPLVTLPPPGGRRRSAARRCCARPGRPPDVPGRPPRAGRPGAPCRSGSGRAPAGAGRCTGPAAGRAPARTAPSRRSRPGRRRPRRRRPSGRSAPAPARRGRWPPGPGRGRQASE